MRTTLSLTALKSYAGVTVTLCARFHVDVVKVSVMVLRVTTPLYCPPTVTMTSCVGCEVRTTEYEPLTIVVAPLAGSTSISDLRSTITPRASLSRTPTSTTSSARRSVSSALRGLLILKPKNSVSSLTSSSVTWTVTVLVVCPEVKVTEPEVPA